MRNDSQVKLRKGKNIAILASVITILLALIKFAVGKIYNTDVLIADALHSLADSAAILASAIGLYIAGKSKTDRFPYGLYKAETLAFLFVGIFIILAAVELVKDGIVELQSSQSGASIPLIPALTAVFSIAVSIFIAWLEAKTARDIKSLSLEANARESFFDIIISMVVLAGIIVPAYSVPYAGGIVMLIISFIVLKVGIESSYRSILILLDANIDGELCRDIEYMVNRIRGVKGVSGTKIREAGPFKMVELDVMIYPDATVFAANILSEKIKKEIFSNFENIESIFIDIKPLDKNILRAVIPVNSCEGSNSIVFGHFGRAEYFAIVKINERDFEIEDFYLNEFLGKGKHIGLNVVKSLVHYNIDILFTTKIGEISFYILKDHMVDIYKIPEIDISIEAALEMFRNEKLEKINTPTHSYDEGHNSK